MNVTLDIDELTHRGNSVQQLLRPLSNRSDGPAWQPRSSSRTYIISVHDGAAPQSDFQSWRFATIAPNFRGHYYELWQRSPTNSRTWYLDRAYLTIFRTLSFEKDEEEYVCLHCDPNEPDSSKHALYKRGPHLHVIVAEQPIPHSHIALSLGGLPDTLPLLSESLQRSIRLIREQILDLVAAEGLS